MSKHTGCVAETIRYNECVGLSPDPPRTVSGHRVYGRDRLKRLTFIRRARELGCTLDQVRDLLDLVDSDTYSCDEVGGITELHIDEVRRGIADLRVLEVVLSETVAPDCPVIDALFEAAA